jgi:hypothetical protein
MKAHEYIQFDALGFVDLVAPANAPPRSLIGCGGSD